MDTFFGTPQTAAISIIVIVTHVLSLALLAANVAAFSIQRKKYAGFFETIGAREAWGHPGRFIVPLYACVTIGSTIAMAYIFVFQPHVL